MLKCNGRTCHGRVAYRDNAQAVTSQLGGGRFNYVAGRRPLLPFAPPIMMVALCYIAVVQDQRYLNALRRGIDDADKQHPTQADTRIVRAVVLVKAPRTVPRLQRTIRL